MAILDVFECSILVDGEALKEYEDDEPDQTSTPKSLSKYVAAVAESHFSVECKVKPKFRFGKADHLSFQISLDGVDQLGVVMSKHSYSTVDGFSNCKNGVTWKNDEAYTVQKFRFATVAISKLNTHFCFPRLKQQYSGSRCSSSRRKAGS